MYVLCTQSGSANGVSYTAGAVLQIPHECYNPASMTRIGTALTDSQQSALINWSTLSPGWPFPINGE